MYNAVPQSGVGRFPITWDAGHNSSITWTVSDFASCCIHSRGRACIQQGIECPRQSLLGCYARAEIRLFNDRTAESSPVRGTISTLSE